MTEYTPTAEEIRSLVESFSELLNVSPYEGLGDTILGQFDRWLQAERAQAWDEGASLGIMYSIPEQHKNPYRAIND